MAAASDKGSLNVACVAQALKESLTARQCLDALREGVRQAGARLAAAHCISDGGDGFLEAAAMLYPCAETRSARVRAPHGRLVEAHYLWVPDEALAIVESADAVGMRHVPPEARSILGLGSGGLGELLMAAWGQGARRFLVGLGGSATCDGGLGMIGVLYDALVLGIAPGSSRWLTARSLAERFAVNFAELRAVFAREGVSVDVATDVESPLIGPTGAARRFAPQKGATPAEVEWLEEHLAQWAHAAEAALGCECAAVRGAGAAGGLGFAFMLLGARVRMGAEIFLETESLRQAIACADVVLTAEGRFDATSLGGKAPWRVAQAARQAGKRVAIVCARAEATARESAARGGVDIVEFAPTLSFEEARPRSPELIARAVADYLAGLEPCSGGA
jgi:glycerate kinase